MISINRGLWVLSGGRYPSVHSEQLRYRFVRVTRHKLSSSLVNTVRPDIEIATETVDPQLEITANQMTFDPFTPVNFFIPFHMSNVPVKGLCLPRISVKTRIKKFVPRMMIQLAELITDKANHIIDTIPRIVQTKSKPVVLYRSNLFPILLLPGRVAVAKRESNAIPWYFIRIKPRPLTDISKAVLTARRNSMADALKVQHIAIEIIAFFKSACIPDDCRIEFDSRRRSLMLFSSFDRKTPFKRFDIFVGRERATDEIHIAKYISQSDNSKKHK